MASLLRVLTIAVPVLTSMSCAVMRAVQRTPAAIESNTEVLRGVERSTTALTPALERVSSLQAPLVAVSGLDTTLQRVAALQASLEAGDYDRDGTPAGEAMGSILADADRLSGAR